VKNSISTSKKDLSSIENEKSASGRLPETAKELFELNEILFSSLPYPAMYVRQKDRIIVAANKIALDFGAKIGGHCWREFGKTDYIADSTNLTSTEINSKCPFCLGNECISGLPLQNNPELNAFGRIWDSYWIKVTDDVFLHYLIDITEHRKLEESLRESEQFLKQTQQIAMLGTYNLDISTGKWVSSEILDRIFGIDNNPNKTFEDWLLIIHPDMRQMMNDYFVNEVLEKRQRFDKEYKIIKQDDESERWVHGLGDLELDDKNQPVRMIGTIRDITERKRSEEEKRFLLASVENTTDRIVVKDLNLRIVAANRAWLSGRGLAAINDIQGKTDAEAFGVPADSEPVKTYMDDERKAQKLSQGESVIKELPIRLNSGLNTISLIKRYPIFDENGNLFCTGTIATDITERKKMEDALRKSEKKYRLLSENIADGIFIYKNEKIIYVNHSVSRMFGYKEVELEGLKLIELISPDYRNYFQTFISFDLNKDQIKNTEIECVRKDNSTLFVEFFLNYAANEDQIYGVIHDITEKKQIQKRNIVKAIIQTEEKERSNFSKELHDGLGPLLSTIKIYLQLSEKLKTVKSRKEIISKAEEILEDALIAVKEISNKLSPHLLTNYGLSSAIQSFATKLNETSAININFQSNATRRIEIEIEVALYRAVIECINNTIKYANAKNIFISLNDTGNQIRLQYKDDGIGFSIKKAFSDKTGLGLFNLQNRIQTIGGTIKMESKPKQGVDYQIIVALPDVNQTNHLNTIK
jgi:PAS domain S-box-containing protein